MCARKNMQTEDDIDIQTDIHSGSQTDSRTDMQCWQVTWQAAGWSAVAVSEPECDTCGDLTFQVHAAPKDCSYYAADSLLRMDAAMAYRGCPALPLGKRAITSAS